MKKSVEPETVPPAQCSSRPKSRHGSRLRPLTVLIFALLHYGAVMGLSALIFFASHLPPKAVNVDGLIMVLFQGETVLTAPRKVLLWLWPGESTPGLLSVFTTVVNSLLWGCALAICRLLWAKVRE